MSRLGCACSAVQQAREQVQAALDLMEEAQADSMLWSEVRLRLLRTLTELRLIGCSCEVAS